MGRHNEFSDAFTPMTFVGNHDVTRIASRVGQDGAVLATAILATIGGIPLIYYGDELAYRGVKEERFGGDDDIRPVFPASPADLSNLAPTPCALIKACLACGADIRGWWTLAPSPWISRTNAMSIAPACRGSNLLSSNLMCAMAARFSSGKSVRSFGLAEPDPCDRHRPGQSPPKRSRV
ncbi:neopullulanase [Cutibacterium acnes JCM 18918]|nr:neopullulanase [Cutibacterium acnes JCM 18918]